MNPAFPPRSPAFSSKKSDLFPKSVVSSSKSAAFPRQIPFSPEQSDFFRTLKLTIYGCLKWGGFDSRSPNILFDNFQGKLPGSFLLPFLCHFYYILMFDRAPFLALTFSLGHLKNSKKSIQPLRRARAGARGGSGVATPFLATLGTCVNGACEGPPLPRAARRKQARYRAKPRSETQLCQAAAAARARAPPGRAPTRNAF